jgi:hypothetical protein
MTLEEILTAAQVLTFEERKKLIQGLFGQLPKSSQLAGSVEYVGDWEAGKAALRSLAGESLARTAAEIGDAPEGRQ